MILSELRTGEKAYIVKVKGHGGFRKRIVEMGFIKGQQVEVMLNAPLQDPVKYKVMGYEVSLRRQEAEMIEVSTDELDAETVSEPQNVAVTAHYATHSARRNINVALVGNPNCGKTSLFNFASGAHERVGNYSGVTVDAKEGFAEFEGYRMKLVDLPGTYSLSAYSPEELYVRKQLVEDTPDVIINVLDASNIERNLYLTTQLMDMHLRVVCALNMFDETERRGDQLNIDTLSGLMGIPMVPTSFRTGRGLPELMREVIHIFESQEGHDNYYRHIHINHGHEIENGIANIQKFLKVIKNFLKLMNF
jgi:ferrous iron transport protein B